MKLTCERCGREFESRRRSRQFCGYACSNAVTAEKRERRKRSDQVVSVWSCGGGVQSTAIAALIVEGALPKPDIAVMTDCGWEKESTWRNVHGVLVPALAAVGVSLQIVKTTDYGDNDVFDRRGYLVIPAYRRNAAGDRVRYSVHCSAGWKMKVIFRWMREQGLTNVENWVGIDADEANRARGSHVKWVAVRYPLLEMGMGFVDCHRAIWRRGWAEPSRSSCIICPQQSDAQWIAMRDGYPLDWARAVAVDAAIRERDPAAYLHRSCTPLDEAIRG